MVNISIDVTDLGGEARPGDKVVLWKPAAAGSATHAGRVISTAPVDVFLTNGKASVPDVEPGDMRVLLQCRGVESQGPIPVTVPDGSGTVTLRSLIEAQFEYSPPIVSAVQEAADNAAASERAAIQAQVRSEAAADRAEDRVDDAINNGAELVRNEVKQDADRAVAAKNGAQAAQSAAELARDGAQTAASTTVADIHAELDGLVTAADGHASRAESAATTAAGETSALVRSEFQGMLAGAESARDAAEGHANRAATSESNAKTSETNAKQSEDNAGDFAAVATTAATEAVDAMDSVADIIGAEYATQEYVDASKWYRGYAKPSDTIDTLTPGWWGVPGSAVAEALDLPVIMIGDVHVVDIGNVRRIQYSTNEGTAGQQIWIIAKTSRGEWGTWRKVFPVEEPEIPSMTKGSAGALKTVPLALTTGHGNSGNGSASGSFRVPVNYSAPIVRWRLALSNRNPRFGNIHRTTATISKIVLGKDEGGGKLSAPKTVATNIAVPDSGDVVYTKWVNSPIDEAMLLAFKYTSTGADVPPRLLGGGWDVGSADPADESVTGTRVSYLPFDMWLEVETDNRTPVIAAFGDSLSSGANADLPVYESWLSQYARRVGALPVHYTQSGDTAKSWASSFTSYKWSRWEHLDLPDAVIYQLGSNDLSASGDNVESLKANTVTVVDHIREVMTANIYAGTITPRTSWDSSTEAERANYNNWLNTLPVGIRDVFDVAAAVGDGATIKPEFDADGTHLNTAGYDAWQAAIDRPVVSVGADVLAAYNRGKGL